MDHYDLTGYYTYRSFLNQPEPADDFNQIRFGEGELFLYVSPDGSVRGTLAFPSDPLAEQKEFMDVTGRVTAWAPPTLELEGIGRPGTSIESFDYEYQGSLAPSFSEAIRQRPVITGTVLRAKPHGNAPAGVTATFVAVKRDFLPPRRIPGVALVPEAVTMLASRRHRLRHAVWHTIRMQWHALKDAPGTVAKLQKRGWWPTRPPFDETRALILDNGAGEDFLFMHRKMIQMLQEAHAQAGVTPPRGWTALPSTDVPQVVYTEQTVPGARVFVFDPEASGSMVPPPARDDAVDRMMKSSAFLNGLMRPLQGLFQSPRFLSALTLGQLGNLLEFTIHGWMHIRWTYTTYDPTTGDPIGRSSLFDIDPKWDVPSNDDLGDFYSSHVHPLFWRLHGWIDERIEDWARINAKHLTPAVVDGVPWFAVDGRLVTVSKPFYWPTHGQHGGGDDADVEVMEEVMGLVQDVLEPGREGLLVAPLTAKAAFREALLGVALPDLPQE